jgi:hypothetical protein
MFDDITDSKLDTFVEFDWIAYRSIEKHKPDRKGEQT